MAPFACVDELIDPDHAFAEPEAYGWCSDRAALFGRRYSVNSPA